MLEGWLREKVSGIRLLFRGTRDGFELKKILSQFYPKPSVLILIRTKNGELIGCYRDKPRNPSLTEKFNQYFTFSLTLRSKLDEQYSFADLSAFDIGNCFISNSLFLVNNSQKTEGSYYTLQPSEDSRSYGKHNYDFENRSINYFMADEIEIF